MTNTGLPGEMPNSIIRQNIIALSQGLADCQNTLAVTSGENVNLRRELGLLKQEVATMKQMMGAVQAAAFGTGPTAR